MFFLYTELFFVDFAVEISGEPVSNRQSVQTEKMGLSQKGKAPKQRKYHCEPVRFPGVAIPPIFEQLRPKIEGIYFYPGDCDRRESPCGATPVTSVTGSQ